MKLCPTCLSCYDDQEMSCVSGHGALVLQRAGTRLIKQKYWLVRLLGRGATGAVYEASHIDLKRPCAIKLLRSDFDVADPYGKLRLRREALTACSFRHPNLVRIDDFGCNEVSVQGSSDGYSFEELFIVMELLEGESLKDYLQRQRKLSPEDAVLIVRQVLQGLLEIHDQGVVHRDLKPANIMLTQDREGNLVVKIVDFGSVKIAVHRPNAEDIDLTKGMFLGSALYTSPEMCRARPLDQRSDLYSVGLILYEMLAGHRAFDSLDWLTLLAKHALEAPPSLTGIPPALETIVMKALQKDPEARIQSAADFARLLADFQLTEANSSSLNKLSRPIKINRARRFEDICLQKSLEVDEEDTQVGGVKSEGSGLGELLPSAPDASSSAACSPAATLFINKTTSRRERARIRTRDVFEGVESGKEALFLWQRLIRTRTAGVTRQVGIFVELAIDKFRSVRESIPRAWNQRKDTVRVAFFVIPLLILIGLSPLAIMSLALSFSNGKKLPESPQVMTTLPPGKYASEVGDEAETNKDLNIRADHGPRGKKIGLAKSGSRVRVIEKFGTWRRIRVLRHGREKKDSGSLGEGWIDGSHLKAVNGAANTGR